MKILEVTNYSMLSFSKRLIGKCLVIISYESNAIAEYSFNKLAIYIFHE